MGNVGARVETFQNDVFATGLDLKQLEARRQPGWYRAADAAEIEQGQMVALDADGELVLADGADVLGVAKWNKVNLQTAVIVDEPHVVDAGNAVSLARPGAGTTNVIVRSAVNGGAAETIGAAGDYSVTAGVITWEAAPAEVVDGQTVFVTYTHELTAADYRFQGRNFFNFVDDTITTEGRLTIIQAPATLFTTHFDTSRNYTLTGTGSNLYCGGNTGGLEGIFTNDATEGAYVGRVIQLPTAGYPFLGVHFTNVPEEAT